MKPNNVVVLTGGPEAVPVMTKDDKRVIFTKLNDVYLDEKSGYSVGWTDARVAEDLGVPKAWVMKIREDDFGPEAANEEIRGLVSQGKTMLDDVKKYIKDLDVVRADLDSVIKRVKSAEAAATPLSMQCERLEKHIVRISKQLGI